MKRSAVVVLATLAAGSGPAFAADLAVPPAQQPFVYEEVYVDDAPQWDGPYAGLRGGYGFNQSRVTVAGVGEATDDFDGAIASLFAGYNKQLGNNVVVGVEADVAYNWAETKNDLGSGLYEKVGTDWSGSLRGRVGYAMDKVLVYLTAGGAVANFYDRAAGLDVGKALYGYTVGAGVDYAVNENIFARLEYRYTGYPKTRIAEDLGINAKVDMSSHLVTAAVGVKF